MLETAMLFRNSLILALVLGLSSFAVQAAEVGRAKINNRDVVLDSDGTWKYLDTAQPAQAGTCTSGQQFKSKRLPVSFCLMPAWRIDPTPSGSMEIQAHNADLELYMGFIGERLELTMAGLRDAAVSNAANATGVLARDIPILKEEAKSFAGEDWKYLEYDVNFKGTVFRFGNYMSALKKGGAVQVVFWSSPAFFDQNKSGIDDVVTTIAISQ
jgi:hypothetical protein